jgi:hypothetical protein
MESNYSMEANSAIFISGPETYGQYNETLSFMRRQFKNVVVIGDGKVDIWSKNSTVLLETLGDLLKTHPSFGQSPRVLVYISMHGNVDDEVHMVQTGANGFGVLSSDLFGDCCMLDF